MLNGTGNFFAAHFTPLLTSGGEWIAAGLLIAVMGVVLARWKVTLGRQRRTIHLQESEIALQRTAADMHAMVNISDANGLITYVNDNLVSTTGFAAEELLGKRARDVLLAEDENDPDYVFNLVAGGRVWTGESKLRRRDGRVLWTRTTIVPQLGRDGRLKKVISLRTDITESKLREQEGPIRAIFDRLQDEVYIFSVEDLTLTYINKRARQLRGWDEGAYQGRPVSDTTDGFDEATFRARTKPLVDGEVEAMVYESVLLGRPVEINLQMLPSSEGEPRFVGVVRDIAARKEVERARAAFVATVSHELRAPLTSIKGAMKLVASGATGPIPEKPTQMIDLALRNVDRLLLLINDLLDLEKLDNTTTELKSDPVELRGLVDEALAQNAGYAQEFGVSLAALPGAPTRLGITGDRDRLMQVLTNLLSNAAKFSDAGGMVEVGLADLGPTARITVTDHGIGIPEEAQARLFERFVQANTPEHNKRPGTGLGLSIVKTIVERHGGTIGFTSIPGKGTTFRIDLPKSEASLRRAA